MSLTEEEKRDEDAFRWTDLHYGASQRIIGLFVDGEVDSIRDSLGGLAQRIECDQETAREAVLVLLEDGDFSSDADIQKLEVGQVFQLTVDWDRFEESRVSIRVASQEEGPDES